MNYKPKYNPQIHHRRSIRLKGYDYSQAGLYFITICCQDRICRFGHIENGEMILNELGNIAQYEWLKTTEIRNNVELGEFIVMPNHFHAIVRLLGRGELHSPEIYNELHSPEMPNNINELHLQPNTGVCNAHINTGVCDTPIKTGVCDTPFKTGAFNAPLRGLSQTIGAIVRGYKSSVTKQINAMGVFNTPQQIWQRNYHDHIIRNYQSYQRISEYIINNPTKWSDDTFYLQ